MYHGDEDLELVIKTTSDEYGDILDTNYTEPAFIMTDGDDVVDRDNDGIPDNEEELALITVIPETPDPKYRCGHCGDKPHGNPDDSEELLLSVSDSDMYEAMGIEASHKSAIISAIARYEQIMDIIANLDPEKDKAAFNSFKTQADEQIEQAKEAIEAADGVLSDITLARLRDDLDNTIKYYKKDKKNESTSEAAKYSKVIRSGNKKFRYDYEHGMLQYIDDNGEVIDEIGLSIANWRESPDYWADQYAYELDNEMQYNASFDSGEFKFDDDLVKKYAGKTVRTKSGDIYTVDGVNADGELVIDSDSNNPIFLTPDEVEVVESLKSTSSKLVNRVYNEMSHCNFSSYNELYNFLENFKNDIFDESVINSVLAEAPRFVAKADKRDKKMSVVNVINRELKNSNLPDNVISTIYRMMYMNDQNWEDLYNTLFGKKNNESTNEAYYAKRKLVKQYKGFKIYQVTDDDGYTQYACYPKEFSSNYDDPEWESENLDEIIDFIDDYDSNESYSKKTESVSITHNDWSLCTGKEYPRGQDKWKFKFYPGGKIKEFEGSYGVAKKAAAKFAEQNGYTHIDCQG